MTTATPLAPASTDTPPSDESPRLIVEYWTVAMNGQSSCGSCDETRTIVDHAIEAVRPLATQLGIHLDILPRTVTTTAEATNHAIAASPTIRTTGFELRPSHPDTSETRIWQWRGHQTASLPHEAALDLLLQALTTRSTQINTYLEHGGPSDYVRRFLTEHPNAETACEPAITCG